MLANQLAKFCKYWIVHFRYLRANATTP
jgi:hypothetical protein